ncbi:MAG: DUF2064 domain-containing protein [Propionibacteriaceae bacterium]
MTRTRTVIVIAKQPVAGRSKTRLAPRFGDAGAADLAAAALADTCRAVTAAPAARRVLYWQAFDADADVPAGFDVVPQTAGALERRLADAFAQTWRGQTPRDHPTLLVGMDTPQLGADGRAHLLDPDWDGADALLGLAPDGGFWAIGLRRGDPRQIFDGVAMSTDRTGAVQLARLHQLGLEVRLLPPLRDVDTPDDAAVIATQHPELDFSARYRWLTAQAEVRSGEGRRRNMGQLFDLAYAGAPVAASTADGVDPVGIDVARWSAPVDDVDAMLVARCRPPVLDLGCGPGRLVVALLDAGVPALGVDVSAAAVATGRLHGAPALRRDLADRLPLEGRWGSVVLLDSNVGMTGDVAGLLARCAELVAPGGLIICEVDPDPDVADTRTVHLSADGQLATVEWSRAGSRAVVAAARVLDLVVAEEWNAGGRAFLSLAHA